MIHLKHPTTDELLVGIDYSSQNDDRTFKVKTTTEVVRAAGFYPEDIGPIRRATGIEWQPKAILSDTQRATG